MKYEGHTEGPWNNQEFALSNEICTRGNPLIAVVQSRHCHSPEELRANARLIAAAPDLLAERDRLLIWMREISDMDPRKLDTGYYAVNRAKSALKGVGDDR